MPTQSEVSEGKMAGSYEHCVNDGGTYRGVDLLENMSDMHEAVEQMFFMVRWLGKDSHAIEAASEAYFRCARGEEEWPEWMKPGIEPTQ
jgi:hypothetical protein